MPFKEHAILKAVDRKHVDPHNPFPHIGAPAIHADEAGETVFKTVDDYNYDYDFNPHHEVVYEDYIDHLHHVWTSHESPEHAEKKIIE